MAGIVREVYFPAPLIYKQGPIRGSRTLRQAFRNGILDFTKAGIPVSKLGIFLGFQTSKGTGGREGLEAKAWFRTVKWQALAARYVAKEMKFSSIWSWGWARVDDDARGDTTRRSRKRRASISGREVRACATAPAPPARDSSRSRTEGQLILSPGLRCQLGHAAVRWSQINPILKLTGDAELAFSNAFARVVAQRAAQVGYGDILAAERSIISARFGGSRGAYLAAIADARANLSMARGIIGDELRRARIESKFRVRGPSAREIADFHDTYGDLQARLVAGEVRCAVAGRPSLGLCGRVVGAAAADESVCRAAGLLSGHRSARFRCGRSARPLPLGALPIGNVREAIRAALVAQAREDRYPTWLASAQQAAFPEAICWRDQMPEKGEVDLTNYLPFLALTS